MKTYDLIILGAGPAGLTAGIYAARYKLNSLIIGKMPGGYASEASEISNFPSYEKISGIELIKKMMFQVKNLGVEIKIEEIIKIKKGKKGFSVKTNKSEYQAKKIILATGTRKQKLNLPGESDLTGKGIAYCATCDAPLYRDKIAGVFGGGNAALTTSLLLTKYAKKVFLIYKREKFRADPVWIEHVEKNKKIEKILNSEIKELNGKEKLESITLTSQKKLKLDGLFIEIGTVPSIELSSQLGIKSENNYIIVNKKQETSVTGVFAAGDITNNPLKQVITACAEGAIAASSAFKELNKESS